MTSCSARLVWASRGAIERRLELQDRIEHAGHAHSPSAIVDDVRRRMLPPQAMVQHNEEAGLEDLVMQAMVEVGTAGEAEQLASAAESAGMVRLVNQMIAEAQRTGVPDTHLAAHPPHPPPP